ncbi:MAG: hypothetical protein ABSG43_30445 [Solirubrobacteraceae bacterium]
MRQVTIAIVAVVLALAADAVAAADSAGQMGSAQVTLLPAPTVTSRRITSRSCRCT